MRLAMENQKQLELEALAAVGEMLLFDKARGNPEEGLWSLRLLAKPAFAVRLPLTPACKFITHYS